MRGERLELLVNKTANLSDNVSKSPLIYFILFYGFLNFFQSISFRKTSRNLARSMFWKNVKLYVIIGAIIIVVLYFIISMACGGLAWQKCIAKK